MVLHFPKDKDFSESVSEKLATCLCRMPHLEDVEITDMAAHSFYYTTMKSNATSMKVIKSEIY